VDGQKPGDRFVDRRQPVTFQDAVEQLREHRAQHERDDEPGRQRRGQRAGP
jgi:hypothetical protein